MAYTRIRRLSEEDRALASPELASLRQVWLERKQHVAARGSLDRFLLELKREWAIETGIIERLYQWDRGITEVLIRQGIDASVIAHQARLTPAEAHHVADLIQDQQSTIDALFDFVTGQRPLSEHYIRSLHQELTQHQDTTLALTPAGQRIEIALLKGKYKEQPNNPRRPDGTVHEYCPPELVPDEMQDLITWYDEACDSTAPDVLAAWLHHRFTQIHPFQDGNGRVARALATLVFLKAEMFPLVIRDSERTEYLDALEAADRGVLSPLVNLFARRQRDAILQAVNLEHEVQRDGQLQALLDAAVDTLKRRKIASGTALNRAFEIARDLEEIAYQSLHGLAQKIDEQIAPLSSEERRFSAHAQRRPQEDARPSRHYFRQIVEVARQLGYFANINTYHSWARLSIETRDEFYLLLSFHGLGREFQGVLVASALVFREILDEAGERQAVDLQPAMSQLFQFNYAEPLDSARTRFEAWLQDIETLAVAEWQRSLTT